MSIKLIDCKELLSGDYIIVDVRTIAEFEKGHIIGAVNIPLFTNKERAEVGTIYKQNSREEAFDRGIEIVGPKMVDFLKVARGFSDKTLAIYCWRGGMRSESIAWLFNMAGLSVVKLDGGYKSYRNYAIELFNSPINYAVLSGKTGAGKTRYLKMLESSGEQVLDLEGLANHMGSSFGYRGDNVQPTAEQFSNLCFDKLNSFDLSKTVWTEDESLKIGKIEMAQEIYHQILKAFLVEITVDKERRVDNILEDYEGINKEYLLIASRNISRRLGGLRYKAVIEFINNEDYKNAVPILLEYYDNLYEKYAKKYPRSSITVTNPTLEELLKIKIV